ncbi:MAG: hypothetical protein MOGMAGMI_00354 [Candidatus Omnitrophica bacterium]|nr:hypothetical protein [Candidatus Omnitrophota bacterium]
MLDKKTNLFQKVVEMGETFIDAQIHKSRKILEGELDLQKSKDTEESDFIFYKAVTEDPNYKIHSQGYKEKATRITPNFLKQMALKDSMVASIIQTRQNQVSNFSSFIPSGYEKGFKISVKNEAEVLEKIKQELLEESQKKPPKEENGIELNEEAELKETQDKSDDSQEVINWELERRAKTIYQERYRTRIEKAAQFIMNCGESENRPFETKKWNFNSYLRAVVRDRLTYDLIATELVPDQANRLHHFFPVDASTVKYASTSLKKYNSFPGSQTNIDLLYPDKYLDKINERDILKLDETLLEEEAYKYVQVINGRIERAFTEDELKIGIYNLSTDIYNNGYGICELELLVGLISSHLNTEYYNKAYFTQGFSAKGILHLKAPLPRRKIESIRQQWHHMIKGSKNSFQTPIFAGMDEVKWIPLTQNHSDIEFQGWMNYLIKIICSIYQIDPQEIGFGFKEEGAKGGLSGDNTAQKLNQSKDKGLYPLLKFLESYVNCNVLQYLDSDLEFYFVGLDGESREFALERQEKEVSFKKTLNEIREEDGLPPLPGADDLILNPVYLQWYSQFSEKAEEKAREQQKNQEAVMAQSPESSSEEGTQQGEDEESDIIDDPIDIEPIEKSVKIEYYKLS